MYQSFAMESQVKLHAVILFVRLNLEEEGCNKGKHGGITSPKISTVFDCLNMCVEMITEQECVTISHFLIYDCTTNKLEIGENWVY